jgi:DNA-binding CsgD family transcriptional regulator
MRRNGSGDPGSEKRDVAFDALHCTGTPTALIDERGRTTFVNRAADELLEGRDGLFLERGALRCADAEEHKRLRAAITGAGELGSRRGAGDGANLKISRPSGKRAFQVAVVPVRHGGSRGEPTGRVVVFIGDPERDTANKARALRELFDLTSAEGQVAEAISRGDSLPEIAGRLRIGYSTVRTHLARVLAKTGARRQSDLVRLLLSVPAVRQTHRDLGR